MNYCVAVWADWSKVFKWVDFVLLTDGREGLGVMHMNKAFRCRAIDRTEVEAADATLRSESLDTAGAGNRIPFVCIDQNLLHCALC